jgi:hypothetical protein
MGAVLHCQNLNCTGGMRGVKLFAKGVMEAMSDSGAGTAGRSGGSSSSSPASFTFTRDGEDGMPLLAASATLMLPRDSLARSFEVLLRERRKVWPGEISSRRSPTSFSRTILQMPPVTPCSVR